MKKVLSLLLALALSLALAVPAFAAEPEQEEAAAWTLYHLGLFQGTGTDDQGFPIFSLDRAPTRAQGVTMLVRLIGQEKAALDREWNAPFLDVPDWAKPYVGYAYEQGLTNGRSETRFDPNSTIRASEYLTFVLRALGYDSNVDFAWDSAWTLSDQLGFTDGSYNAGTKSFDRGDVTWISANALDVKGKGSDKTLRETLAAQGIHSNADRCLWEDACQACRPGEMVFSFTPVKESKEVYTKFVVNRAWANGVPCEITKQYSTAREVAALCKELSKAQGETITLPNTFGLSYLQYDENAAEAAASETVTAADGVEYPVIEYKLKCTGTLARNGSKPAAQVEELVVLHYYIDGYGGQF